LLGEITEGDIMQLELEEFNRKLSQLKKITPVTLPTVDKLQNDLIIEIAEILGWFYEWFQNIKEAINKEK